jgi:uncharacterized DUF497 family protein
MDDDKADLVLKKHGIDFWLAARVFDDAFHVIVLDPSRFEYRWKAIGVVEGRMLTVVHADGGEGRTRLITVWPSTQGEIDDYYTR